MNFYNPYYIYPAVRTGLFSSLRGSGFTLSNLLNGTQRTLGIINQAIPIVKQMSPVMKNAKTMFKVMNEFKKVDSPKTSTTTSSNVAESTTPNYDGSPTFFA